MNNIERRFCNLPQVCESVKACELSSFTESEQRAAEESSDKLPKIVGYSAVFGVDTEIFTWFGSFNERIKKGAFRRAIREGQDVRALRNHNPDNLLGRTTSKTLRLREDDTGLWIEVDSPDTTIGRDTVEQIRRGDLTGMSFAFIIRKEKWVNGEDGAPSMRIIEDVDLFDVGPVTYPQYTQTTADLRASSIAHQVGLAELGLPVPALPSDSIPVKVLEINQLARAEQVDEDEEIAVDPAIVIPDTSFAAQYQARSALATLRSRRLKYLTK